MIDLNALEERLRPWREAGYEFTWGTEGDEVVFKIKLEGHEIWHDVFYPDEAWENRVLDEAIERGVIVLDGAK